MAAYAAAAAVVATFMPALHAQPDSLRLITHSSPEVLGQQGNRRADAGPLAVSGDGRFVVFSSASNNWFAEDTDSFSDVYVADATLHTTTRLTYGPGGGSTNGASSGAVISADGQWIAFTTAASDLALPGAAGSGVYLVARETGIVHYVARPGTTLGYEARSLSLSADGDVLVFASRTSFVATDTDALTDHYLWRRSTASVTRLTYSVVGGSDDPWSSSAPVVSPDGRQVAFSLPRHRPTGNPFHELLLYSVDTGTHAPLLRADGTLLEGEPASLSYDGRYIALTSSAALSPADHNDLPDAYRFDRATKQIELVSVASDETPGNSASWSPAISGDGQRITFSSISTNLHADTSGGPFAAYLRDHTTGTTTLLSPPTGRGSFPSSSEKNGAISLDGGTVVLTSSSAQLVSNDSNNRPDVFRVDLASGRTTRVSVSRQPPREGSATSPRLDAPIAFLDSTGSTVHFSTLADNLVASNEGTIFRHDLSTGITTGAAFSTLPPASAENPLWQRINGVSDDGTRILFQTDTVPQPEFGGTYPLDLGGIELQVHRPHGLVQRLDDAAVLAPEAIVRDALMSASGHRVVSSFRWFEGFELTGGVYVHELAANITRRIDVGPSGTAPDAPALDLLGLSRNGRFVAFGSLAGNLVPDGLGARLDLYLHDVETRTTTRIVHPAHGGPLLGGYLGPVVGVSDDGQALLFVSSPSSAGDDYAVWRIDRSRNELRRLAAADPEARVSLSADGRIAVFESSDNLLFDARSLTHIYAFDQRGGRLWLASTDDEGSVGDASSHTPHLSADGSTLVFVSGASNFNSTPRFGGEGQIYVRKLTEPAMFRDGFE